MEQFKPNEKFINGDGKPDLRTRKDKKCSDLFKSIHNPDSIKQIILSLINYHYVEFENVFETWPREENCSIDESFFDKKAKKILHKILDLLSEIEIKAAQTNTKFVIENIDTYVKSKVRQILEKENLLSRKPECGDRAKILCSELFKQRFGETSNHTKNNEPYIRLNKALIQVYRSNYYSEVFNQWPKTEEGDLDRKYVTKYAKGLFEIIKNDLEKKEQKAKKNDISFQIRYLNSYVFQMIKNFISDENKRLQGIKRRLISQNEVEDLQVQLNMPSLNMNELEVMAQNQHTKESEDLKIELKKLPGYRGARFKMDNYRGNRRLFVYETYQDRLEKIEFVTRSRRDEGTKWNRPKLKTEQYSKFMKG